WMLNKNQMKDKNLRYLASFGGTGGIMIGLHLSTVVAINGELMYAAYSQKFRSGVDSIDWTSNTNLSYLEVPVLLHFDMNDFRFLELGVKFCMLQSARERFNSDVIDMDDKAAKPNYEKNNTALVFGWGTGVWGNGGLLVSGGLRLTYGLSDLVSELGGKGQNYLGSEGLKSYQKTNTATVGFHINMDFDLGWFSKSSCGRNYKFTLFSH
ncbi:MAG TPA: outer membrane beta-barrel protein, partial [Candidatus Brocadiaceae bacterium]